MSRLRRMMSVLVILCEALRVSWRDGPQTEFERVTTGHRCLKLEIAKSSLEIKTRTLGANRGRLSK